MKTSRLLILSLFTLLFSTVIIAQKDVSSKSKTAISDFKKIDPEVNSLFKSAYGYAVFPKVGKGGIGIGGATGNGTVFRKNNTTGDCRMTQISIGFQFGGQNYAQVIFFEDEESYNEFIAGNYQFSAQVSAVALKSGASANAKYKEGVLVFTNAIGGLMYEASVGGQKFKVKMY